MCSVPKHFRQLSLTLPFLLYSSTRESCHALSCKMKIMALLGRGGGGGGCRGDDCVSCEGEELMTNIECVFSLVETKKCVTVNL